jgi:hypothetical protein
MKNGKNGVDELSKAILKTPFDPGDKPFSISKRAMAII